MTGVSSTPGPNQADIDRLFDDPALRELRDRGSAALVSRGAGTVIWANDPARALLGEQLSTIPARLAAAGQASGPSLRLRRLLIDLGRGIRPLSFLTRTASLSDGSEALVAVVLGAPEASAPQQPAETGDSSEPWSEHAPSEPVSPEETRPAEPPIGPALAGADAVRARLLAAHPHATVRFLWQSDENGRVTSVSSPLGEIVGAKYAGIVGRRFAELAEGLQLDPSGRLSSAIEGTETWSGIEAAWPIAEAAAAVPVDLGAFPILGPERTFGGFRGFGVLHLDRIREAEPLPDQGDAAPPLGAADEKQDEPRPEAENELPHATSESPNPPEPGEEPPEHASVVSAANVVPLRPYGALTAVFGLRLPPPEAPEQRLSDRENEAFDEIARTLNEPETSSAEPAAPTHEEAEPADRGGPAHGAVSILERLPLGILISRDERLLYANRTLLDLSGYPDVEALQAEGGLARLFDGLTPVDMQSRDSSAFSIRSRQGEVVPAEGKLQALSWEGQPASLLTLRPITNGMESPEAQTLASELHNREAELRQLRAILDSATDGIALLDANGRILSLNRPAEMLFGYEQNELAGEPFTMLLAPESRRPFDEHFEKMRGEDLANPVGNGHELAVIAPEGGTIPIVLSLAGIGGGDQQASFCAIVHSLATSRGAEKAARDARAEAERASAVKSDFLAKVSHEIRTPLNAIIGFAEVIMDERLGPVGTERYRDYLRDIHRSGTHVMSLVNDLLDLSKIEAGKMALDIKPVDANAIISECVGLMQPQANRERVIMRLALAPRLMHVAADERSLRQIILNLLSNAVKYNEPGGQVIVSTAMTEAGHAVIRIKDTGIGMSDAELAVALEPFRQVETARSVSGTGLGLPLTKALIEANHADFTIRSRKNEGTLVEVTFLPARVLAESA